MAIILRRKGLGLGSCRGICEASNTDLSFVRNDTMVDKDFEGHDMVIRWGCTSNVPIKNVLNTAKAIHTVNDKSGFRMKLMEEAPDIIPYTTMGYLEARRALRTGTLIVRPAKHAQGKHVYHVRTEEALRAVIRACGEGWYASEYIPKEREFRVFVAQGRAVWVAEKTPGNPDDVAWNVAKGGRFDNVRWGDWPLMAVKNSIEAFNLSGLDFGGVDVMTHGDKAYVIEINSAPSQTSPYRQGCVAKVFDHISKNDKEHIHTNRFKRESWKKYIHPAISEEALV